MFSISFLLLFLGVTAEATDFTKRVRCPDNTTMVAEYKQEAFCVYFDIEFVSKMFFFFCLAK